MYMYNQWVEKHMRVGTKCHGSRALKNVPGDSKNKKKAN